MFPVREHKVGGKKLMANTTLRDSEIAIRVKRTAEICGVSKRLVYMVIIGDRTNQDVLDVYMHLKELEDAAFDIAKKTALIRNIEGIVPFEEAV